MDTFSVPEIKVLTVGDVDIAASSNFRDDEFGFGTHSAGQDLLSIAEIG